MQASSITNNIIKTCSSAKTINILSDSCQSLFDLYLSSLDNILTLPIREDSEYISCDLILSHHPISFSSKISSFSALHIQNILYFHSKCPDNFKKEDKFLLKNSINNSYKIFTDLSLMKSWGFEQDNLCVVLPYGVRSTENTVNKTRSVVVLNINNNPSVNMLFQHIKTAFKDSVMIDGSYDQSNIIKTIAESVVCIEAESYYNIIQSIANGCSVISSVDYILENGLYPIASYDNIIQDIYKVLQSYSIDKSEQNKRSILEKYSHHNFVESFTQILEKIRQEPYIYAKAN